MKSSNGIKELYGVVPGLFEGFLREYEEHERS